jgi:hypothetical protein
MDIKLNTIHYLTEPCFLEKYSRKVSRDNMEEDLVFYRKRIYLATKTILRGKTVTPDINSAFNSFAKLLIQHLKIKDTNDILQREFIDISMNKESNLTEDMLSQEEIDKCMFNIDNDEKTKNNNMLDFVKKVTIKSEQGKKIFLPKQKTINLKDPAFRTP